MKKNVILISLLIVLICSACSKIDTEIDLSSLKNDSGAFCYKNLNLNSSLEDAKKIIGHEMTEAYSSEDNNFIAYTIDMDFELFDCKGIANFEFENDKLTVIKFVFIDENDDVEAMYTKLIERLNELYLDSSDSYDSENETEYGKIKSEGYMWDFDDGNILTSLQVSKMQRDKAKATVTLSVGILS